MCYVIDGIIYGLIIHFCEIDAYVNNNATLRHYDIATFLDTEFHAGEDFQYINSSISIDYHINV